MSRRSRAERMAAKGRPKRRAAKTHFFKYQLANNPSRAEENDLKRALQESLEEQNGKKSCNLNSSTNSSDVSRSNNSSFSNCSNGSVNSANLKRTRSSTNSFHLSNKRSRLSETTELQNNQKCDGNRSVSIELPAKSTTPHVTKAIRTYSRSQPNVETKSVDGLKSPTPTHTNKPNLNLSTNGKDTRVKTPSQSNMSRSTQTPNINSKLVSLASTVINNNSKQVNSNSSQQSIETSKSVAINERTNAPQVIQNPTPVQDQYLKFKRESKNYAYVKMTALKVSTSKSPSSYSKSSNLKKSSPNGTNHNNTNKAKVIPKASSSPNGGSYSTSAQLGKFNSDKSSKVVNSNGSNLEYHASLNTDSANCGKNSPPGISTSKIVPTNGKTPDKTKQIAAVGQGSQVDKTSIPKHDNHDSNPNNTQTSKNDCSFDDTLDLSKKKNQIQADVKLAKRRLPQGSWSLLGVPEERVIYLRNDEPPRRLICYPAIKHVEGDVIQVRDSVLLRSGARKTDLPYIAKVCAFWVDLETSNVMMSLFWYYRPEHTEDGRKPHHLTDEIFASRHRDMDSVECIEDKCYVLTFNEYCRYRKRCKMEQVNTTWSLTDVTIPVSNESYPRRNRIPDSDVNPELVFCCRQIYDSRMKRLLKNPLINPKYGHI